MFCPKCKGIQEVIKVHEGKDLSQPRLCDVQCLKCGHIVYYQAYDFGSTINAVPKNEA
jgi:RNase P subunit RPR2